MLIVIQKLKLLFSIKSASVQNTKMTFYMFYSKKQNKTKTKTKQNKNKSKTKQKQKQKQNKRKNKQKALYIHSERICFKTLLFVIALLSENLIFQMYYKVKQKRKIPRIPLI